MISKTFLLAGNATFTVSNPEGQHYTFKVTKSKAKNGYPETHFIAALTGPDNHSNYTYMGMVLPNGVKLTQASKYTKDSVIYKVANWSVRGIISGGELPAGYSIDHAGACGRCGRKLTTPESIKLGLGPICARIG